MLKTVAFLIGWIVSFQFIPTGLHIMSKPSSIYFTLGILFEILVIGSAFYFAFKFGEYVVKLIKESRGARLEKLREQFKKDNEKK